MIDIKLIRENKELVAKNNTSRNVSVDLDALLALDGEKIVLQQKVDKLRAERNVRSKTKPSEEEMALARKLGEEVAELEDLLADKNEELQKMLLTIPNLNHETTPVGKDESVNKVERKVGEMPVFNFQPQEHFAVPSAAACLDTERGAKMPGSRFYFYHGKLAILERAVIQYAVDYIVRKGFELFLPPLLVKEDAMYGTGFFPAEKNEIYSVNPDDDDLYLIGTSEVPLVSYHSDETLELKDLPKKYVSVTPCFRREAGSYGKDTKGVFRVHQFYKVEMVLLTTPAESWQWHEAILKIEEEILNSLGLAYQVLNLCSGDLGFPAAKKYDCEGWFPGQGRYRELTSTSNTTDYQARRSNIKFKNAEGKREFVHTLNGTGITDRTLLAVLENFQTKDGG